MLKKLMIYEALKQVQEKSLNMAKTMKNNVCRLCMASNAKMVGIFDCVNRNLAKDIQFCTGIHIQKMDNLPKKICNNCLSQLKTVYIFKNKCLSTEKKFKNLYSYIKPELNKIKVKKEVEKTDQITISLPTVEKQEKFLETKVKQEVPITFLSHQNATIALPTRKAKSSLPTVKEENDVFFLHSQEAEETLKNQCINVEIKMEKDVDKIEIGEEINGNGDIFDDFAGTHVESDVEDILNPLNDQTLNRDFKLKKVRHKVEDNTKRNDKFICEICGRQLANSMTLRAHMKSHQPPSMFCAHCDYKTNSRSDLCKHLKLHTEEKHYQCGYCAKMFRFCSNLYVHIRRMHENIGSKKYNCTICDCKYTNSNSLKRHYASHLNERKFECEMCSSRFNTRKHWKRHLKNLHNIILPKQKCGRRRNMDIDTKCEDPRSATAPLSIFLTEKKK